ncbi:MAG: branched-chain amino acid ABC transporter permease [Desulfobacterota bacterium]|nr:branched-chain amino acid ABC transporter permease [Thermodesulfobacteriota bacterium]
MVQGSPFTVQKLFMPGTGPRWLPYGVLILIVAAAPLVFSGRMSYYLSILSLAGIYAVVVIGLNMLMGYAGQISLGHAAFFAIGAYTSGILSTRYGLSPILCALPAVAAAGSVAVLIGIPTLKLKEHYLAMATLGFGIIMYTILRADPGSMTGGIQGMPNIPPLQILGHAADSDRAQYTIVWSTVILVFLFSTNILESRFGRALMAIHKSEVCAAVLGINVFGHKLQVFVLSALYAGFAGFLYAHCSPLKYLNPDDVAHVILSIKFVTMVVIGGMGNRWGALCGAVGLTVLPEVLRLMSSLLHGISSTDIEMACYGLILIMVMILSTRTRKRLLPIPAENTLTQHPIRQ